MTQPTDVPYRTLAQPSPYGDKGSVEALALAGQSGALWRGAKRLSAKLQEVRDEVLSPAWRRLMALTKETP